MKCPNCGTKNRIEAKFCKHCGNAMQEGNYNLYAKSNAIETIRKFKERAQFAHQLKDKNSKTYIGFNCLILGDAGTGKQYLSNVLFDILLKEKLIQKGKPTIIDAADIGTWTQKIEENINKETGGVLVISNVQKILPDTAAVSLSELDPIFAKMKLLQKDMPIIIMTGIRDRFSAFIKNNPDINGLFEYRFDLNMFSDTDLTNLCCDMLEKDWNFKISPEARIKMKQRFSFLYRKGDTASNGHVAAKIAEDIAFNAYRRKSSEVIPDDIHGEIFIPKSEEQIFAELDSFIGLQSVKAEIRSIINMIKASKLNHGGGDFTIKDHFVFTGNPGTGKTTIARIFADMLNSLGILPTGQLIEIAGKDLIGQYIGSSEVLVQEYVEKAQGGILFIDEAYGLNDSGYGKSAIDKLLPMLENLRGKFICIIAGYTSNMIEFLRMNPGLESRFNKTIDFPDYNSQELCQIFEKLVSSNGYVLSEESKKKIQKKFDMVYLSRTDTFGNARVVRNIFNKAIERHNSNLVNMTPDEVTQKGAVLEWNEIVDPDEMKDISVEDIMAELEAFVGMASVKKAVKELANEMAYNKKRLELGVGNASLTPVNIVLTGNPGTGKTSVARIFGKLFKAIGVIPSDRVVEKERKDIVGQYVNESDKNMDRAINEAMGGVLFIDEAYNIAPVDDLGKCTDSEGTKAIERLMTRMENDRGKFVLVCAGYKKNMENFLRVNPGLKRRFTHFIHIEDYTPEELTLIFKKAAQKEKYIIDTSADSNILKMFEQIYESRNENFGNAGEAMQKFAQTKRNQANRIKTIPQEDWTKEMMLTIMPEDIPYEAPVAVNTDECMKELNSLIGLEGVKKEIQKLIAYVNREQTLAKLEGKKSKPIVDHYLFLGNPGTGKTTVARLMGQILFNMGILARPDVIEVTRDDLIAGYVGQTAIRTKEVVRQAMGGVLFIDEAYALKNNPYDNFGEECINTLVPLLENNKGKFVCIAAGYSKEMKQFIDANSGMKSRFTKTIIFEDYNGEELYEIFLMRCKKEGLAIDDEAVEALKNKFQLMYDKRGSDFGNARDARNVFEAVKQNLAERTANSSDVTELKTITKEDIQC